MKKTLLCFTFLLTNLALFAQGATTCAGAVAITTNGTYLTGALNSGTYPTGTGLCFGTAATKARWYKYTPAQGGLLTITSDIAANAVDADTRLSILTGTCGGTTWTCIDANDDVSGTNYRSAITNLTVNAGTTYYIVWDNKWETTSRSFDFTFVPQTCFKPTAFTYTAPPTTTSVGIGWTSPAAGTPIGYQFEYGLRGFTQGAGTLLNPTTTSVSLSSLSPSSVYSFYVRTNCGAGDYSVWEGPIDFNTVFETVNPTYNTSFEDTSFDFIGWVDTTPVSGGAWGLNDAGAGDPTVQDGDVSAFSLSSTTAATNSMLISRGVNLVGGQQATISFYAANYLVAPNTTSTASFDVNYGADQTIATQTNLIGSETNYASTAFTLKTYNFTPSSTGTYYFSIKHTSPINAGGGTQAFLIDNFTVSQTLSTNDFVSSKFKVYPNPVNDIVTISNQGNIEINKVTVTDINGRTVKLLNLNGVTETRINVSELNAGVYFIKIDTNEGVATKKIVKN